MSCRRTSRYSGRLHQRLSLTHGWVMAHSTIIHTPGDRTGTCLSSGAGCRQPLRPTCAQKSSHLGAGFQYCADISPAHSTKCTFACQYDKYMTLEQGYPGLFYVGLLQPAQNAVDTSCTKACALGRTRRPSLRSYSAEDRKHSVSTTRLLAVYSWKSAR